MKKSVARLGSLFPKTAQRTSLHPSSFSSPSHRPLIIRCNRCASENAGSRFLQSHRGRLRRGSRGAHPRLPARRPLPLLRRPAPHLSRADAGRIQGPVFHRSDPRTLSIPKNRRGIVAAVITRPAARMAALVRPQAPGRRVPKLQLGREETRGNREQRQRRAPSRAIRHSPSAARRFAQLTLARAARLLSAMKREWFHVLVSGRMAPRHGVLPSLPFPRLCP